VGQELSGCGGESRGRRRGAADGLGTVYGVTREQIRQVEMMGLKTLSRGPLRERLASFIGG